MIHVILAVLYFGWKYFISGSTFVQAYQSATTFLFWWVAGLTILKIVLAIWIGMKGEWNRGSCMKIVLLLGFGGEIGWWTFANIVVTNAIFLFLFHLLRTSYTLAGLIEGRLYISVLLLLAFLGGLRLFKFSYSKD